MSGDMIKEQPSEEKINLFRLAIKVVVLFLLANLIFALLQPNLGRISFYNWLFPGRERFPFGENPGEAYNFSLFDVEAMYQSHHVDASSEDDSYQVFIFGDSSVWGTLLHPEETLAGQLNAEEYVQCSTGEAVEFFNLGYPTISVTKDLMLMDEAVQSYEPDLVIWMVTLEAMPWDKQLASPLAENNPQRIAPLVEAYDLPLKSNTDNSFWQRIWSHSLIGERRNLADWFRLQFYGVLWSATGIDQIYPENFRPAARDLEADEGYYDFREGSFSVDDLAFPVLAAGEQLLDGIPMLIVNEPILISSGEHSDIRYNFYYPRWAYDQYRQQFNLAADTHQWNYHDLWNIVPETEFTNSAIHLSPAGEAILAKAIGNQLEAFDICEK